MDWKLIAAAVVVFAVIAGLGTPKKGRGKKTPITRRNVLTKNEQPMYFRLQEALPEFVVLAQVAFSALVTTRGQSTRNKFDRKVADFVVCTKAFGVVAVIELDDSSHKGKEAADKARDALLREAGHPVLRYKKTPDKEQVRKDVLALIPVRKTPPSGETAPQAI